MRRGGLEGIFAVRAYGAFVRCKPRKKTLIKRETGRSYETIF